MASLNVVQESMESRRKLEALAEIVEKLVAEINAHPELPSLLGTLCTSDIIARHGQCQPALQPILTPNFDTKTKE